MRYFKRRLIWILAVVVFLMAAVLGVSKWKKQENIFEIHSYHDVIQDLNTEEGEKYKKREPGLYQPGPLKYEGNGKYVPKNIKFTSWAELEKQGILTIEDGELSTPIDDNEGNYLVERYISGALILPDNITTIAEDTFSFCSLKEVIIPEGVEKISSRAFKGCAKLSCISIPESLQIIGESAFSGCEGMENLKIPESAETIEYNAFFNVPHVEYQGTAVYAKEDIFWGAESMNGKIRSDIQETSFPKTKTDSDGIIWIVSREITVEADGFIYHAYLSEDGKYSWIQRAEPKGGETIETLAFPEKIEGAALVKLGKMPKEDSYWDIFGNSLEPYHELDGWDLDKGDYVDKRNIRKIVCPASVKRIAGASFCGFRNLEEIVLPEKMERISEYLLFNCTSLERVVLPLKPDFTKSVNSFKNCQCINEIKVPKNSKTHCAEKGMVLSKDKKVLYQVMMPKKTVNIPKKVSRIASHAVNAWNFPRIRSVKLSAGVRILDENAIMDDIGHDAAIQSITVHKDNTFLAEEDGCIFECDTGTLVAAVCRDGTLQIPAQIRQISDRYSIVGDYIRKLVVPDTLQGLQKHRYGRITGGVDLDNPQKVKGGKILYTKRSDE